MSPRLTSAITRTAKALGFEIRRAPAPGPRLTYTHASRLLYFKRLFDLVSDVEGDVVECGVGRGNSLALLAFLVKEEAHKRHLWAFDSFEGFPEPSSEDASVRHPKKGQWGRTGVRLVEQILLDSGLDLAFVRSHVTLVKGFFEDSLPKYAGGPIALLHLDVDLYDSYRTALTRLYPHVAVGGVVLFDEYMGTVEHLHFPGAQKAIAEYFGSRLSQIRQDRQTGKYYLIKREA
ncbi:MAG: class I SAM-dependent methyltransferase [Candidatus Omnitrophica bacterium]|nr:class I SAM-dependent methyltransferase [Candidatus Omnitrophota bacterium]